MAKLTRKKRKVLKAKQKQTPCGFKRRWEEIYKRRRMMKRANTPDVHAIGANQIFSKKGKLYMTEQVDGVLYVDEFYSDKK